MFLIEKTNVMGFEQAILTALRSEIITKKNNKR